MVSRASLVAIAVVLTGCSGGKKACKPGECPSDNVDESIAKFADFKTRMCKCDERECVSQIDLEYQRWLEGLDGTTASALRVEPRMEPLREEYQDCSRTAGEISEGKPLDIVQTITEISDAMCACKDLPCAKRVELRFKELGEKYEDAPEPSPEVMTQLSELISRYAECRAKL